MRDGTAQELFEAIGNNDPQGLLLGFVLVCEWVDENGKRWLTRIDANASGERLPEWQRQGYLHNALHTEWEEDEGDDE